MQLRNFQLVTRGIYYDYDLMLLVSLTRSAGLTMLRAGCHRQQMVVVLVGVQCSMDSPICSQIGPFQQFYMM